MRIRIRQHRRGEIDGVPLEKFHVGLVYDVPASVATYLLTTGCAEFVLDSLPGPRAYDQVVVSPDND
jgi:hypothetical protein